jgi:hypothetical protein
MAQASVEAIVAIVGVIVALPPSIIVLWSLIRRKDEPAEDIEVCCAVDLSVDRWIGLMW